MNRVSAAVARCAQYGNELPPANVATVLCLRCGCIFLDYPAGLDAHWAVFGHRPSDPA